MVIKDKFLILKGKQQLAICKKTLATIDNVIRSGRLKGKRLEQLKQQKTILKSDMKKVEDELANKISGNVKSKA